MQYTRFSTAPDGGCVVDTVTAVLATVSDYADGVPDLLASEALDASGTHVLQMPAGWVSEWHTAPARQLMVLLEGGVECDTASGQVRFENAGAVVLVEDTRGRGHRTRVLGVGPAVWLVVRLRDAD